MALVLVQARANVIELDKGQFKATSHFMNSVSLGVTVETNGHDHIEKVLNALRDNGFDSKHSY